MNLFISHSFVTNHSLSKDHFCLLQWKPKEYEVLKKRIKKAVI